MRLLDIDKLEKSEEGANTLFIMLLEHFENDDDYEFKIVRLKEILSDITYWVTERKRRIDEISTRRNSDNDLMLRYKKRSRKEKMVFRW